MKHRDISGTGASFLLVFDEGDELKAALEAFATDQRITQAGFTAVGALSAAELIAFDVEAKEYRTAIALDEQCELATLTGNIGEGDDGPVVHAHAVIGRADGAAFAGHLKRGVVRPTCELILTVYPVAVAKLPDEKWGLSLYRP